MRDANRHLSAKVAKLQDGVAGALIAMEEGDGERAIGLLEKALGFPVLERAPEESRKESAESSSAR